MVRVRFSRVWRAVLCMGYPLVRWSLQMMTQDGGKTAQFQGDHERCWGSTTKFGGMCPVLHDGLLTTTFGLGRCTFHNQYLLPKAVIDSATNMVSFRPDEKHSCYVCTWGCWRHRATNSGPPRRRPLLVVPVMPDADGG